MLCSEHKRELLEGKAGRECELYLLEAMPSLYSCSLDIAAALGLPEGFDDGRLNGSSRRGGKSRLNPSISLVDVVPEAPS